MIESELYKELGELTKNKDRCSCQEKWTRKIIRQKGKFTKVDIWNKSEEKNAYRK